jgi:hypothetical protein
VDDDWKTVGIGYVSVGLYQGRPTVRLGRLRSK